MRPNPCTCFVLGSWMAAMASPEVLAQTPGFGGLGDLPGGAYLSEVFGISGDGSTVVGWSNSTESSPGWNQAFKWSAGEMVGLPDLPGGLMRSSAGTASYDGTLIVGDAADADGGQAVLWRPDGQVVSLGAFSPASPMGTARGISDDGQIIVGSCTSASGWQAFRWTQAGGMVGMGDLAGGSFNSAAQTVTTNAQVIFGTGTSAAGASAFRWTPQGGMLALGDLPGGGFFSEPYAATPDGTVMVGRGQSAASGTNRFEALLWTQSGGLEGLGDLPGGVFESFAMDVTNDGGVVVGFGTSEHGQEAVVWTRTEGMRRLVDAFAGSGSPPAGWTLTAAMAISGDGRTIAGNGINPAGQTEAWVWTLPPEIPASSSWGVAIFAASLLGAAGWFLRDRTESEPAAHP